MNMSEPQILALNAEDKHKLIVDLSATKPSDKNYANAQAIITFIKSQDDYEEPRTIEVMSITDVTVDGKAVGKGQKIKLYLWQYRALARFFKIPSGQHDALVEEGQEARATRLKQEADERALALGQAPATPPAAGTGKTVASIILAFLLLILFGAAAQAQVYRTLYVGGLTNSTFGITNAGLIGGTNTVLAASTNYFNTLSLYTNVVTNSTIVITNGTPSFSTALITNVLTNIAGTIGLTKYDMAWVQINLALTGSSTGQIPTHWNYSGDGISWVSNAFTLTVTTAGTAQEGAGTNLSAFAPGYIQLNDVDNTNASAIVTNLIVQVDLKPIRTGP